MRRPYQVGHKLRDLRRRHVEDYVRDKLSVSSRNCRIGISVHAPANSCGEIILCTLPEVNKGAPEGALSACSNSCATTCPHYMPRTTTREEALDSFRELLSDPVRQRALYPDVVALEWVLDNSYHELAQKRSWGQRVLLRAIDALEWLVRRTGGSQALLSWGKVKGDRPPGNDRAQQGAGTCPSNRDE